MEEDILVSPVDGRKISLTGLSRIQLRDLHYHEEVEMARRILKMPPFSDERNKMMNEGYAFVEALKLRYEPVRENKSFGASPRTVRMVSDITQDRIKLMKRQQTIYEAGVGLGYALREIIKIPDIKYYGCDVTLLQDTKRLCDKNENVFVNENTLYDDIQRMGDNSIDVFYADNVIEHLIPDEADEIFKLLHRKMKRKGILVLVIPNRYLGPSDVTKYYLAKGDKAKGFHFMEMSYSEVIRFAKHHGFKANYIYKDNKVMKDFLGFQNMGRTITENYFVNHKNISVREELMSLENFNTYILSR